LFSACTNRRHFFFQVARAGIQGCASVSTNANGAPVVIHNCATEPIAEREWDVPFSIFPENITIFGDKVGTSPQLTFNLFFDFQHPCEQCLDVTDGVNAPGTKLQIWTCSGGPNQQWMLLSSGVLQWAGTDKCVDLTDGRTNDGNQLQLYTCVTVNSNQIWAFPENPDKVVYAFSSARARPDIRSSFLPFQHKRYFGRRLYV
jgi:hypothetical protein